MKLNIINRVLLPVAFLVICGAAAEAQFVNVGTIDKVDHPAAAWGDYNNDGFLDLLINGVRNQISAVYGNVAGFGIFNPLSAGLHGVTYGAVAWGDYDCDGDLDLYLSGVFIDSLGTYYNWTVHADVYRNDGNGIFTPINAGLTGLYMGSAEWGDYDNDGDPDLLITGNNNDWPNDNNITLIYRNDGNDSFSIVNPGFPAVSQGDAAWGDYDNDGFLDCIVTGIEIINDLGYTRTSLFRNNGNGTFTYVPTSIIQVGASSVAWGDYDNDGWLDILIAGRSWGGAYGIEPPVTKVYRNVGGTGVFSEVTTAGLSGISLCSVAWGDYNNDGLLDILIDGMCETTESVSIVYRNNGNGTFSDVGAGLPGSGGQAAIWGDYDNDGWLDFLLPGFSTSKAYLYRNTGSYPYQSNKRPDAPQIITANGKVFLGTVTLKWKPVTDDETPPAAMTYNIRVGTAPGKCDIVPADCDSSHPSNPVLLGNVQNGTFAKLSVPAGTSTPKIYYWAVQAIDGGYRRSEWSREAKFVRPSLRTGMRRPDRPQEYSTR